MVKWDAKACVIKWNEMKRGKMLSTLIESAKTYDKNKIQP